MIYNKTEKFQNILSNSSKSIETNSTGTPMKFINIHKDRNNIKDTSNLSSMIKNMNTSIQYIEKTYTKTKTKRNENNSNTSIEKGRNFYGLKEISALVQNIIKKCKKTTYKAISDMIIDDLNRNSSFKIIQDEKNIRRRIYDSLNVMKAMELFKKDKKTKNIIWNVTNKKDESSSKVSGLSLYESSEKGHNYDYYKVHDLSSDIVKLI